MKKIVAVLWHNSANRLNMLQSQTDEFVCLKVYSAAALSDGRQDLDKLYRDMDDADAFLFQVTSSDSAWIEIEEYAEKFEIPMIYVGGESAGKIKTKDQMKHSAICNQFYVYSGAENMVNMMKYICSQVLHEEMDYQEPIFIPWEGIFHPDSKEIFQSTKDYFAWKEPSGKGTIALLVSRTAWLSGDIEVERALIKHIEKNGYTALPIFSYAMADIDLGAKGTAYAIETFCFDGYGQPIVDGVIRMTGFFLQDTDEYANTSESSVMSRLNCPIVKPICSYSMTLEEWEKNEDGSVADIAWNIALPELEGVIEPIFIGAEEQTGQVELRKPLEKRCEKLVYRLSKWIALRKKENKDKRVVFILNNNPCTAAEASVGGGANLDTLESVVRILHAMKEHGYQVEHIPENGDELIKTIMDRKAISDFRWTTAKEIVHKGGVLCQVTKDMYMEWFNELPEKAKSSMIDAWGEPIGEAMVHENTILVTGISFQNALVCVQPKRGCVGAKCDGTVCKILHDPHVAPTHQYFASYRYFERVYQADVIIHVGTHGNLEFLPGKGVGLSDACFPDICIGTMPNLYIYNADNPPEGTIAKRRALATIIDHMQMTMTQSGLYDSLEELDELLNQYDKVKLSDPSQAHLLEHFIIEQIQMNQMLDYINLEDYHNHMGYIIEECHKVLTMIKNTQIQDGMHIFGQLPQEEKRVDFLYSILRFEGINTPSIRSDVSNLIGLELSSLLERPEGFCARYNTDNGSILFDIDRICKQIIRVFLQGETITSDIDLYGYTLQNASSLDDINARLENVLDINRRIESSKEIEALLRAMDGSFIEAGPAGIITRGRDDVLPTGRNFYTLDPEKVPTKAAWEVGKRLADSVIQKYKDEEGTYPESVAIYWMTTDIMWADGEGMAQLLYLLGVEPVWLSNGKVKHFKIIALNDLGRPRIDITVKISGILRDNFQNCVCFLDDAIQAVSKLKEPLELNFVRKHALENQQSQPDLSWDDATSRIFGAQPGTYSSGINLLVYASAWENQDDISDLFMNFNSYSYGRNRFGKQSPFALESSLKHVDITYDKVMSDEHDLLGCCCYFGNHGGMTAAARKLSQKEVKAYYGDSREVTNIEVRTLSEEINRVVKSKLLNPKWIEGQKQHGYKGAGDISKRVGRVYGWEATTEEVDDWVFDDITKTFIVDENNRKFFQENNPWALEEMSRRLIEAYQRKLWNPEEGLIGEIQDTYLELEGFLEESMGNNAGDFQGSSIDVVNLNDIETYRQTAAKLHTVKYNKFD